MEPIRITRFEAGRRDMAKKPAHQKRMRAGGCTVGVWRSRVGDGRLGVGGCVSGGRNWSLRYAAMAAANSAATAATPSQSIGSWKSDTGIWLYERSEERRKGKIRSHK